MRNPAFAFLALTFALREHVPARSQTVLLPTGTLEAHGVTANGADILARSWRR